MHISAICNSRVCVLALLGLAARPLASGAQQWSIHDMDRPAPPVVDPGSADRSPSDAIVLFGGENLSQWRMKGGEPAKWKVDAGYIEIVPGSGDLVTTRAFGDCQLHLEWATPASARGEGQDRGNSGVFLMGRYEVQVLDSYRNRTYADGQAAAIYGQFPPLVNASRPPGEWQEYDIIFHRPRFDKNGKLLSPARMTVFHNRVLVHYDVELVGATAHRAKATYTAHPDRLPLLLQDHGSPVRYRNLWLRELAEQ
jgi:3-keto-disaccharide hydrolase